MCKSSTKAMNAEAADYDCANLCKNIEKDNGCDFTVLTVSNQEKTSKPLRNVPFIMFLLQDSKCHFGKVSHTSGSSSNDHPNSTVYFLKSKKNNR